MSAYRELQADYQEWRQLAEAEGDAIRNGDWIHVVNCQHALQFLQPRIVQHTAAVQKEWSVAPDRSEREEGIRALVRPLIDLELRNYHLLEEHMRAAQVEMGKFAVASQTLRRIQRSYAPAQPAAWTSFS